MTITIHKISLSNSKGGIWYDRPLPNGKVEECHLALAPIPEEIQEPANALLPDAIEVIGLDSDRWASASVIGLTMKWDGSDLSGLNVSLLNKEDDLAVTANTPHLNFERITVQAAARVKEAVVAAIGYIESQPVQLELEDALQLPECEFAGVMA